VGCGSRNGRICSRTAGPLGRRIYVIDETGTSRSMGWARQSSSSLGMHDKNNDGAAKCKDGDPPTAHMTAELNDLWSDLICNPLEVCLEQAAYPNGGFEFTEGLHL
jgi:hypothetical protein